MTANFKTSASPFTRGVRVCQVYVLKTLMGDEVTNQRGSSVLGTTRSERVSVNSNSVKWDLWDK